MSSPDPTPSWRAWDGGLGPQHRGPPREKEPRRPLCHGTGDVATGLEARLLSRVQGCVPCPSVCWSPGGTGPWCLTRKGRSACAKPHAVAGNGQLGGTAMACPGGTGRRGRAGCGRDPWGVEGTHAVSDPSGAASPPQTTPNTGATPSVPRPPSHRRLPSPDCE